MKEIRAGGTALALMCKKQFELFCKVLDSPDKIAFYLRFARESSTPAAAPSSKPAMRTAHHGKADCGVSAPAVPFTEAGASAGFWAEVSPVGPVFMVSGLICPHTAQE